MIKAKSLHCYNCACRTPHSYVGKKATYEGFGLARGIMAVASLGTSEMWPDHYWQCDKCGEVQRDNH